MELQILDPFEDYATAGYLRNVYAEHGLNFIGHLETAAFQQEVLGTIRYLRRVPTVQYEHRNPPANSSSPSTRNR
jgi:hypothetical protein